jgi:hypothetical protein
MALNVSFTTTFNRVTGKITFADTTNYAAQGYPLGVVNQMKGYISVTYNTGSGNVVVYNNTPTPPNPPWPTPDSSNAGAVVNFVPSTINIPLTTAGLPIPAQYTVTYTVVIFQLAPVPATFTFSATNTYDYNFTDPSVCIETVVNCMESAVQSTDDTVYDVPNGVVTNIVRQHTLYPPPTSGIPNLGPLNQITLLYTPIYTTTWTAEVISTVTYLMNDGLIIIVDLAGVKEFQAICDTNLSKIICCLVNLQNEYEALLCKNPVKAELFRSTKLDPSLQHLVLFLAAQSAGNQSKMDFEYSELIDASGCGTDCGCGDSTPVLVQPTGVGFAYALTSTGNTITITTSVVGNTITWNIELSAALQAAIASITNTQVSTTTPQFISVTQVGAAPNLNYQVDFDPNEIDKLIVIDPNLNASLDYLEFTNTDIVNLGSKINPVGSQNIYLGTDSGGAISNPNVASDFAVFVFSGLLVTGTDPFTVTCNVMRSNSPIVVTSIKNLEAEVFYVDDTTGDVYVRLYNPQNGQAYTLQDIKTGTWDKIFIKFNFKA